ncbi:MAG: protein-disulfide reductase DsbD domain-containing protein [Pyrinomonadaceae bacterium]
MQKFLKATFAVPTFIFCLYACASAQTVSGSIGPVERGDSVRGSIVLDIPGELHVNSSRPASRYAIPTTVRLTANGGAKVSGPSYPRGVDRRFQFSEQTINVYEGRVKFPFTLRVPANFKGNVVRVRAVVRYQACTNEVCYPPRSKEVALTARVK